MSIINSIRNILMGMGTANRGLHINPALAAGGTPAGTVTLTQPVNCGYFRVKIAAPGAGVQITDCEVVATDGTTQVSLDSFHNANAPNGADFEWSGIFQSDRNLTSFVFTVAVGGVIVAGATQDYEVWGTIG